jgi:hypothetical protein
MMQPLLPLLPLLLLLLLLLAQSARAALVDERTLPLRGSSTPASLFVPRGFVSSDDAAHAAAACLPRRRRDEHPLACRGWALDSSCTCLSGRHSCSSY